MEMGAPSGPSCTRCSILFRLLLGSWHAAADRRLQTLLHSGTPPARCPGTNGSASMWSNSKSNQLRSSEIYRNINCGLWKMMKTGPPPQEKTWITWIGSPSPFESQIRLSQKPSCGLAGFTQGTAQEGKMSIIFFPDLGNEWYMGPTKLLTSS